VQRILICEGPTDVPNMIKTICGFARLGT